MSGYEINGIKFSTKKSAQQHVRERLENFNQDNPLWVWLLDRHPESKQKTGPADILIFFGVVVNILMLCAVIFFYFFMR